MKYLFFGLFMLILAGCNRPDPQPEVTDAIYLDIQSEIGNSKKSVEDAKKQREDYQTQSDKAAPQNGQGKYFQKRVDEMNGVITKLEQQEKFWMIRSDSRRDFVRLEYLKAFKKGKEWDASAELVEYQTEKRLRKARVQWDARQRREDFLKSSGLGPNARKPSAEGGEGGEKPAPKEE